MSSVEAQILESLKTSKTDAKPLTISDDWTAYHAYTTPENLAATGKQPCIIDDFLLGRTGNIFELGCGSSAVLARAATLGWTVSGIDFNASALAEMQQFVKLRKLKSGELIMGDVLSVDTTALESRYDLLVSFGFLEHFVDPVPILAHWKKTLKPDGHVITTVPNLRCINAWTMKRYHRAFWNQHVIHTPETLDRIHQHAGYEIITPAHYTGRYDLHWLTPWDEIQKKMPRALFLALKILGKYLLQIPLGMLPESGSRVYNTMIRGVYARK